MLNAQQILEKKGFDLTQIADIIHFKTEHSEEGLDMQVRTEFKVEDHPLHLWESYYIGDADEEEIELIAKEQGYDSIKTLFRAMDARLIELCENIPALQKTDE